MVVVKKWFAERKRAWKTQMKKNGTKNAISAAAQMGTISCIIASKIILDGHFFE
jgi:hypothetical protein